MSGPGRHRAYEPLREDHTEYHVVGFVAAPPGWRVVALDERGTVHSQALPGWLIQEEVAYQHTYPKPEDFQSPRPWRRVVAAIHEANSGELCEVYETVWGFWYIAGPDERSPTPQAITAELAHRAQLKRVHALAQETKESKK